MYSAPATKRKSGPKLIADAGPMKRNPGTEVSKVAFSLGARSRRSIAHAQLRIKERKAFDINIIAGTGNDMINDELTLTSVLCNAQPKRHAAAGLAGLIDRRSDMDGHPILNPIAKPPCAFGWQMVLDEAGSPLRPAGDASRPENE